MLDSQQTGADWPEVSNRTGVGLFFLIALSLTVASVKQLLTQGVGSGKALGPYSWEYVALIGLTVTLALMEVVVLGLTWTKAGQRLSNAMEKLTAGLSRLGWVNVLVVLAVWVGYAGLVLWYFDNQFADYILRVWLLWLAAGVGALFLFSWRKPASYFWALMAVGVVFGVGLKALSYLPEVTSNPFTLSWSEASRFYYASLPFARKLYGFPLPLSALHPSRYLLLGLPFLIPHVSILVLRLWQVLLWLVLSLLSGYALARRLRVGRGVTLVLAGWAGLYLLQGPVYYHLLISVILVLWGFDRQRPWKTLIFVLLASAWAGISRVNWFPVPAFLAAALYILEKPVGEEGSGWRGWARYIWPIAVWGAAGLVTALAG